MQLSCLSSRIMGRLMSPLMIIGLSFLQFTSGAAQTTPEPSAPASTGDVRYPLKTSDNGRYVVDQNNTPVFLVGDAPQDAFTLLDEKQWSHYLADRKAHRVNAL